MQRYEKYKDSGVDWIGEIPEHWECKRLGSLLTVFSSKNHSDKPLLSITRERGVILRDLDDQSENHNFIPDDLSGYKLIKVGQFGMNKMKAWQGSYGISDFDGIVSPAYFIFNVAEEIYPKFFHRAIRSNFYVAHFGSTSDGVRIGQWDLSKPRMREIPFFIPPFSEQQTIATFLDDKTAKIDQTIAIKEKEIELLKERRQILIQKAVTKGLDDTVTLKDSGVDWIGDIPEHWEVRKLKYVLTMRNEKIESKSTDKVYVGMENIESQTGKYLQTDSQVEGLANVFYKDDILFGKLRPYLAKVYFSEFDGICSTEFLVYKSTNASFYQRVLLSDVFIKLVDSSTYGAKMPRASTDFINNISIPTPPNQEQTQIVSYLEVIEEKIAKAILLKQQEIEKLKEYKTVLIDNVVTGKVKIN